MAPSPDEYAPADGVNCSPPSLDGVRDEMTVPAFQVTLCGSAGSTANRTVVEPDRNVSVLAAVAVTEQVPAPDTMMLFFASSVHFDEPASLIA